MSSITTVGKSPDIPATPEKKDRKGKSFSAGTPLTRACSAFQMEWLLQHVCDRYTTLHGQMGQWRGKMAKWERMSEQDYTDRRTEADNVNMSSKKDIFSLQNDTLGTVGGFYDFHFAQTKDDIFGTRPWLAATPEGKADNELADTITKHSQWKLNYSDVENVLHDALKISTWGGTAFVKAAYRKTVEVVMREQAIPYNTKTGKEIRNKAGLLPTTAEELAAMGYMEEDVVWKVEDRLDTETVYENVTNGIVDYNDISFESTAPELTLRHTDVFCRFKMGLLDVMERYKIPQDQKNSLMAAISGIDENARDHRDESQAVNRDVGDENTNPTVTLIEGFVRCAVKPDQMARIHCIFSPDLRIMFSADYLANVTPSGTLPVFPVRINRIQNRVFGIGYFEKYESQDKAIDRQYNLMTYRNRSSAHVWTAFNPNHLADDAEGEDIDLDPNKPHKLKEGSSIDDLIQFKTSPDNSSRSENLLNSMLQMIQMRSGITSAAQGELKGVPSANTATGTRDLQSRGATIIKAPIDEQISDIRAIVEYDVHLIYANLDQDETFTWGEGREAVLMNIKANDVLGLRANVSLTMTQAQNQRKFEAANQCIQTIMTWLQVPEVEKASVRYAFVQALNAIGFNNAEDIIRQAAVDAPGIIAMLPPEMQPIVAQALAAAGYEVPTAAPMVSPSAT